MFKNMFNKKIQEPEQKGQSLIEVIIVMSVGLIVISALVFATISGLRNAQFSKNQSLATKFAQEGIESVKGLRDKDGSVRIYYSVGGNPQSTSKFSDIWISSSLADICGSEACYLKLSSVGGVPNSGLIEGDSQDDFEPLEGNIFYRQVQLKDGAASAKEKFVTVIVKWKDFSGDHESKLTTILRKL